MAKRILIADDDHAILDAMQMMLELEGYEVDTVSDGKVIEKMEQKEPDILLLDIWMSGQDGRDICKQLKKQKNLAHVPVLLVSASRDIKKSADDSGADDFLAKPFEMDELLEKVARYTKRVNSSQ